jgi:hypothetical protein
MAVAQSGGGGAIIITGKSPEERYHEINSELSEDASKNSEDALDTLSRLRDSIERADLSIDSATVRDLERSLARQIEIPFVRQRVDARIAFWILGLAATTILTFLYSLLDSIYLVLSTGKGADNAPEILDWVLLHPSKVAAFLGVAWIFLPCVLTSIGLLPRIGVIVGAPQLLGLFLLFIAMLAFGLLMLRRTLQIRSLPLAV